MTGPDEQIASFGPLWTEELDSGRIAIKRGGASCEADEAPDMLLDDPEPARRLSILELDENTCKWPIGDPGSDGFHFCGRESRAGAPYCEAHCNIAYAQEPDLEGRETEGSETEARQVAGSRAGNAPCAQIRRPEAIPEIVELPEQIEEQDGQSSVDAALRTMKQI